MAARALGLTADLEALPHQEALPHPTALPFTDAASLQARAEDLPRTWPPPASVQQQVAGRLVAELRMLGVLADANARGVAPGFSQLVALLRRRGRLRRTAHGPVNSFSACGMYLREGALHT